MGSLFLGCRSQVKPKKKCIIGWKLPRFFKLFLQVNQKIQSAINLTDTVQFSHINYNIATVGGHNVRAP